ncbi:DUF108 domain-containing protein [bacterium]|nr:DUF108 domain-containing protein [bacterium]
MYNALVDGSNLRLGILGCGAIGSEVARAVDRGVIDYELAALCDIKAEAAETLANGLAHQNPRILDLPQLIAASDVILESAQQSIVPDVVLPAVMQGKTAVVMSVGGIALLDDAAMANILGSSGKVHIPSGAVGGIDALLAAKESGITSVILTTRKPPVALGRDDDTETVIFEGSAEDAVAAFPKNINVAMTIRLAIGADVPFTVRIVSDPDAKSNTHRIEASAGTGRMVMKFENESHPIVKRTSYLAPMSAIALLRKLGSKLTIGA